MSEPPLSKRRKIAASATAIGSDGDADPAASEREESDFEEKQRKKRKLRHTTVRRKGKLNMLPDMPLDILFHIFGYTHPKDLINITRTNRMCRHTLLSPEAVGIWKTARRQLCAPDPLSDFSEPRWANLLFGGAICEICGRTGVKDPDFHLRRKTCKACFTMRTVDAEKRKFLNKLTELDNTVLDLVPHTTVVKGSRRGRRDIRCWWISDIAIVVGQLRALKDPKGGAEKDLQAYREERLAFVTSQQEHAIRCQEWFLKYSTAQWVEKVVEERDRYNAIKTKFIELGYEETDVERGLKGHREAHKVWLRVRPKLEPSIQEEQQLRLREQRLEEARSLIESAYARYLKENVSPKNWRYQPSFYQIQDIPEIASASSRAADSGEELTDNTFASLFNVATLPHLLSSWQQTWRQDRQYQKWYQNHFSFPGPRCHCALCVHGPTEDLLNLASAIFCCWSFHSQHTGSFVYSDGHYCRSSENQTALSKLKHKIARDIVRLAGLDPDRATAQDMDARKVMFKWTNGQVYRWREIIFAVDHVGASVDSIQVLTEEQKADVMPYRDPSLDERYWSCGHCGEHLQKWGLHDSVVNHVKSVHGIDNPETGEDVITAPEYGLTNLWIGTL